MSFTLVLLLIVTLQCLYIGLNFALVAFLTWHTTNVMGRAFSPGLTRALALSYLGLSGRGIWWLYDLLMGSGIWETGKTGNNGMLILSMLIFLANSWVQIELANVRREVFNAK